MSDELDKGADRDTRPHPCTKRTWCVELAEHEGSCVEAPRAKHETPNFGPKTK